MRARQPMTPVTGAKCNRGACHATTPIDPKKDR